MKTSKYKVGDEVYCSTLMKLADVVIIRAVRTKRFGKDRYLVSKKGSDFYEWVSESALDPILLGEAL